MAEKVSRALDPRDEKLTIMVTGGIRGDLEGLAQYYGWSLSKTACKLIIEGMKAVWADRASDEFLER